MKVSTLVFDLDGTISDPSSGIVKCVNYALQCHGCATQSDESISAEIGPPLDLMFRKFMPDITDKTIDDLVYSYRERFATDGFAENVLYDGIPAAFEYLKNAGFRLGVCTSKPEPAARKVLGHFKLLHHFDFVSGGDIGVAKQSQLKSLLDEKTIDLQALMIGDRSVDLTAAHNNGLKSAAVLWGFGSTAELAAEKPVLTLASVVELTSSFELIDRQSA